MTLGQRISTYRKQLGISQEALGERLGVSRQAVSKWEGDLSRPAAGKLVLLSETLDIPKDAWQAMDAEEAAAQAAARETEGARKAKRWRKGFAALGQKRSAFFSHQDPAMVEWFVKMVEERKHQHDASREKKSW